MAGRKGAKIENMKEFHSALKKLSGVGRHDVLLTAAKVGMLPILEAVDAKVPKLTRTLQRSLKIHHVESTQTRVFVTIGTKEKYARRLEYGFEKKDSLGRQYHQQAQPYLRPAYDEQRPKAIEETKIALKLAIAHQLGKRV